MILPGTTVTIKNHTVKASGTTTLKSFGGWIAQAYFGKGMNNGIILVEGCNSSGTINDSGGGIIGAFLGLNQEHSSITVAINFFRT